MLAGALAGAVLSGPARSAPAEPRWFADRPVAWDEFDREHVEHAPRATHLQDAPGTLLFRDSVAGEIDRVLSLDTGRPAEDVNAMDEVPCSTWFCARNHRRPMTVEEIAAGPQTPAPQLPLRIVKGKDEGATGGFQVRDAAGRKYMLKLDAAGHVGLCTGAEMVGERFFHAAGYNVPGAFLVDLARADLVLDPKATFQLNRVQPRPLTKERVNRVLSRAGRLADGRLRAVAVPWVPGQALGGFDNIGRRLDDPNDRIPHELRRSLRGSWLLFAWLGEFDPSSINSLDSYVDEGGRKFVRHYLLDFGTILGSATNEPKGPNRTTEYTIEVGRTIGALLSLGLYRRPVQIDRGRWQAMVDRYPAAGWFPADEFDPELFRTYRKVPSHVRRTDQDLYWGAKIVTSFSDQQIAAVLATARMPPADTAYLDRALRVRRDIIGQRYLRAFAAVEDPEVDASGAAVCFDDLAVARGYAKTEDARYRIRVTDGHGARLLEVEQAPARSRNCAPLGEPGPRDPYRIVSITSVVAGGTGQAMTSSKPSRIHLRWRPGEQRFAVVGLERDHE
jgi:hypothetical protein